MYCSIFLPGCWKENYGKLKASIAILGACGWQTGQMRNVYNSIYLVSCVISCEHTFSCVKKWRAVVLIREHMACRVPLVFLQDWSKHGNTILGQPCLDTFVRSSVAIKGSKFHSPSQPWMLFLAGIIRFVIFHQGLLMFMRGIYLYFTGMNIWGFPKMGVPPEHPFQIGIFHEIVTI